MIKQLLSITVLSILLAACSLSGELPAAAPSPTVELPSPVTEVPTAEGPLGSPPLAGTCTFTAFGIAAPHPVYDSGSNNDTVLEMLDMGMTRRAIGQTEYRYMITTANNQTGFVSKERGSVEGDCELLPFMPLLEAPPEAGCAIRVDGVTLHAVGNPEVTIPSGEWLQPLAQSQNPTLYKLALDNGTYWVEVAPFQQAGLINGPCESLPVEDAGFNG